MLKGINKNVIVVKTGAKSRFEAVYFVLKKGSASAKADIIKEANKIIRESVTTERSRRARLGARTVLLAILGAILGAAVGVGICLLVLL